MKYKYIINNLKSYNYSQYKDITSYEKLMCLAILILKRNNVPLIYKYIYIYVGTYKLFPDKFCLDEEFNEYPNGAILDRTLMHLKYVNKKNSTNFILPYITGTLDDGYEITTRGKNTALETEAIINHTPINTCIKTSILEVCKKDFSKTYFEFISSKGFLKYLASKEIDLMHIWEFFNVIPYTELKRVKEELKNIKINAKNNHNNDCIIYVGKVLKMM